MGTVLFTIGIAILLVIGIVGTILVATSENTIAKIIIGIIVITIAIVMIISGLIIGVNIY